MRRFVLRLRNVVRPSDAEPELARELASHLTLLADELERRGMPRDEAVRAARLSLGGVEQTKERHRDARSFRWLDETRRDVQYALRMLQPTPGFTAVAILTLALGIGANTAVFSLVNTLLLRTLPVAEPGRLVTLSSGAAVNQAPAPWTYAIWDQVRQRAEMFDGAFAWSAQRFNLAQGGEIEPVDGLFASGGFFSTLGVRAVLGRTFASADDGRGGGPDGPVAVISYGLWQRRFGGAAHVIGARLVIERVPFTIIGVTPPEFFGAEVGRGFGSFAEGGRVSVSSGLIIGQVALSLVLVVAALLFVRTFARLTALPLGFDSDRVLVVSVNTTRTAVDPSNRILLYRRLVAASAAVAGVAHAAGSMVTPVSSNTSRDRVDVPGAPAMPDREHFVLRNAITPGWFAAYGTPLRAGRDVDDRDVEHAPAVVVVNEAFARRFFPGRDPIGSTVGVLPPPGAGAPPPPKTIVGVVGDAIYRSLREDAQPTIYVPLAQAGSLSPTVGISIRSAAGSPTRLAPSVAAALTAVDRDLAFACRPLRDQVDASLAQERLLAMLSGFFGALALLLAAVGLYGVTAYAAGRRRSEIGIRMALGARRLEVLRLVMRQSAALTIVGLLIGLGGAIATTRYLEGLLFGVTPLDPATFIAVALMFAVVATVAAYVPARRATKVDPLLALRCE